MGNKTPFSKIHFFRNQQYNHNTEYFHINKSHIVSISLFQCVMTISSKRDAQSQLSSKIVMKKAPFGALSLSEDFNLS